MTVYMESIFFDNFLPNTLLLYLTSRLIRKRNPWRILIAGAFGGIYAVMAAWIPFLTAFYIKLIAGIFMCLICFGAKKKMLLKGCLSFFAASLLFGGITFALFYASYTPSEHMQITWRLLLAGALVTILLFEFLCRQRPSELSEPISVEMICENNILLFTAEFDSGTTVADERGNGVMLLDRKFALCNMSRAVYEDIICCPKSKKMKTRFFTVHTAAGKKRLIGFLPDQLTATRNNNSMQLKAYVLLADDICLNGSPAIYGRGVKTEE